MATIAQAFETFAQTLELKDDERKAASEQQVSLRENLRKHLGGVKRDFVSGSYARRTAIRPLNDIDLFLILDPVVHAACYPPAKPLACLQAIQRAVQIAYPHHNPILQGRSVHIDLPGGIGYDLVPAFEERTAEEYKIPDRDRKEWIRSNPEKHMNVCKEAHERAGGMLNRLIKMAKRWNCEQKPKAPLRSFHLEVMCYEAFTTKPASFAEGLAALFGHLERRVLAHCPEPAKVGPHIDQEMKKEERTTAHEALVAAAGSAGVALAYDKAGRTEEAHGIWRKLLGNEYPERGR